MFPKRILLTGAITVAIFVAVASVQWSKVVRTTLFDGCIQREHLLLGRFKYTSMTLDSRVRSTELAVKRLRAYGMPEYTQEGLGVVTRERGSSEYDVRQERKGDIHREASQLAKSMPWLRLTWHGKYFTSFYARGTHPSLGGVASVYCARLPERRHGPGLLRVTASVQE